MNAKGYLNAQVSFHFVVIDTVTFWVHSYPPALVTSSVAWFISNATTAKDPDYEQVSLIQLIDN